MSGDAPFPLIVAALVIAIALYDWAWSDHHRRR